MPLDRDMEIVDIDSYNLENTFHVEVVYVERHMKRREIVSSHSSDPQSWLFNFLRLVVQLSEVGCRCVRVSGRYIEGLQGESVGDQEVEVVSTIARSYDDLAQAKVLCL